VNLLFDENLSLSFVHRLADLFPNPDDATISAFARDHDYVVVTNLRLTFGSRASRVAWIRSGNDSTNMIEKILRSRALAIEALADDEAGVIDIL
jgi:predicted nuclease of predicted toxin-antitoxin system